MGTLAQLKSRIASELNRSDLTTLIAAEIPRAIERYAAQRFWFNESVRTATTTAGSTLSTADTGPRMIDQLQLTVGSSKRTLEPRSPAEIQELLGNQSTQGIPTDYAFSGSILTFWPTPNGTYTVTVTGIFDLDELSSDSSTNAWTTEAEDLICWEVVERLARTKVRNAALANEARGFRTEALSALRAETVKRLSGGVDPA
jgi:hypothetical protein